METFELSKPAERRDSPQQVIVVLVLVIFVITVLQIAWIIDGHQKPQDFMVSAVGFLVLVWGAIFLYHDAVKPPEASFAEVNGEGIRIKTAGCDTFLRFSDIKAMSVKERISWRDNFGESFTWLGRDYWTRGRHVEIRCLRPQRAGHWIRGKKKVFRVQPVDMERFMEVAEEWRERYRGA